MFDWNSILTIVWFILWAVVVLVGLGILWAVVVAIWMAREFRELGPVFLRKGRR
jgi:hypothetical protein